MMTWRRWSVGGTVVLASALMCTSAFVVPSHCGETRLTRLSNGAKARCTRARAVKMSLMMDPTQQLEQYIRQEACLEPPKGLSALMQLLIYRGQQPAPLDDREELHPLLIPLTRSADQSETVCLLRWPTPSEEAPTPVVRVRRGSLGMRLLAPDVLGYAHRIAVEEDVAGGRESLWAASLVNALLPEEKQYSPGACEALGRGVSRFLFLKVGSFPDVFETLAQEHLAKGDQQSALITCEKAYSLFPGWGQPFASYARVLSTMKGRELEMRDAARVAMKHPLWTVAEDVEGLDFVLQTAGSSRVQAQDKFYKLYLDERLQEVKQGKRPEQVAADRAAFLMDAAMLGANGITSWKEIRGTLSELYTEARLTDLANFVR